MAPNNNNSDDTLFSDNNDTTTNLNIKDITENMSSESKMIDTNPEKFYGIVFLSAVTGISAMIGFGTTLAAIRKKDPQSFQDGMIGTKGVSNSGASLAMRALGWGTVYAFAGCGILFYGIWKLSGATNTQEFREKMGSILPRIPKNNPPKSRTEFEGLNDLLTYVSDEWNKENKKIDE